MQGEAARGWNPVPQRVPEPPVTTRRVYSDAPDPGAARGPLPPFRPATPDVGPHANIIEALEPTADTPLEPTADVELEPIADILPESADVPLGSTEDAPVETTVETTDDGGVEPAADLLLDAEPRVEPDASTTGTASASEAGRPDQAEPAVDTEIEEAWLLDEIVEADQEPWDALGEALQEAVARAAPPFAEDLVRSDEQNDPAVIQEPPVSAAPPGASPAQVDAGTGGADIAGALDRAGAANPSTDGFTDGLAATLESLAASLRARGFNALDDAFARGDRLEASLALFLAGYRAGRGE